MEKNDEFISTVVDYTHDGFGIVKKENFPFFVENVIVGEKVKIKIVKIKKNFGYAILEEVINPSKKRLEEKEKTSGASIMHMNYEEQLNFKTQKVKNIIKKTLKDEKIKILNTIGMENPIYYRNKSVLPVKRYKDIVKMGYYKSRTHDVEDIYDCKIQFQEHNYLTNKIRKIINDMNISIYDEDTKEGSLRHIMFRTNKSKTEIMVVLISKNKFKKLDKFVSNIKKISDKIVGIILNINDKNTNVILGEKSYLLYGKDYIIDEIEDLKFKISPKSFYQINPIQTQKLYNKIIDVARLDSNDIILDAYCGIGTISLFLAKKAKKVYGIEVVESAIRDANENAKLNNINNVTFILGKAEEAISTLLKSEKINVVVVDPPRKGCEEIFLQNLVDMNIEKIVYVSCNPATLARDMKFLKTKGYYAREIQPVDMFPHTPHVETVVLMSKVAPTE